MYDELVKALRNMSKMGTKYGMAVIKMREAADAIEELCGLCASQSKDCSEAIAKYLELWTKRPRWIPVTERLPGKQKYVLVRYKNNDMAVACWFDGDEDILFWRAMTDEGWCADCDTAPTHWMPLPEPPIVEESE